MTTYGLRKYVDAFVREEITVDMLPLLTDDHLAQLGIVTIGAKLQFKSFIDALQHDQQLAANANGNAGFNGVNGVKGGANMNNFVSSSHFINNSNAIQYLHQIYSDIHNLKIGIGVLTESVHKLNIMFPPPPPQVSILKKNSEPLLTHPHPVATNLPQE